MCFAYWYQPYRDALASIAGSHGYKAIGLAGLLGFFAPWFMGRAFMTEDEAQDIADQESRAAGLRYDLTKQSWKWTARETSNTIKIKHLVNSLVIWSFQAYIVYKMFTKH